MICRIRRRPVPASSGASDGVRRSTKLSNAGESATRSSFRHDVRPASR